MPHRAWKSFLPTPPISFNTFLDSTLFIWVILSYVSKFWRLIYDCKKSKKYFDVQKIFYTKFYKDNLQSISIIQSIRLIKMSEEKRFTYEIEVEGMIWLGQFTTK